MKAPPRRLFAFSLLVPLLSGVEPSVWAQAPNLEAYRKYSLTHEGDVARGAKLFNEQKLLCSNCHSVDGKASKAGPDLFAVGVRSGDATSWMQY